MFLDFYIALGLLVLISSIFQILNFRKIFFAKEWYNKFIIITKRKPTIIDFRQKSEYNIFTRANFLFIFDFFWILLLCLTKYWTISMGFILLNTLVNFSVKKMNYNIFSKFLFLLIIISKILITFLILTNQFFIDLF